MKGAANFELKEMEVMRLMSLADVLQGRDEEEDDEENEEDEDEEKEERGKRTRWKKSCPSLRPSVRNITPPLHLYYSHQKLHSSLHHDNQNSTEFYNFSVSNCRLSWYTLLSLKAEQEASLANCASFDVCSPSC